MVFWRLFFIKSKQKKKAFSVKMYLTGYSLLPFQENFLNKLIQFLKIYYAKEKS
jgi:hypothetical protein